ncbi:aryl-alcohol dehydrogenase-like predicted oxidoreductase [Mumia flava]|uniref:Aryl-alcohol dehydrogenase-like predicted oxidoreductase n=1 Tax=Mumia flava TaxID=1348852 RepID=A0A0B2B3T8_9ACTN|nr:aldo/keto reductase [Mumia flava]PJJ53517.1 aryl-alcohol dehydrogenase-like predicted oxidoreductase [Mumia flava]
MRERFVGRSGLAVSALGLGTASWGRDVDEHEARDLLTTFLDAGGTLLDTGASYGAGTAESVLGAVLADIPRDDVILVTKAGAPTRTGRPGTSRGALLGTLDASLGRLGVDTVDLWLVQRWDPQVPSEETLAAMEHAVTTGRTRYVGVANHNGWQTAYVHTRQAMRETGAPIVADQVEYSLVNRTAEAEVLPAADALGFGVIAWSALGRGVLTGKYRHGVVPSDSRAASDHLAGFVEPYLQGSAPSVVEGVCRAADGLGLSPAEVALAWIRDRPAVASALVGPRTAAQLKGLLTVEDVVLPDEIVSALDDVSAEAG